MLSMVTKQPETDKTTSSLIIPDDILIDIFLRLPVRPLLLLTSVSKHFLSLIQNPYFIHLHINRPDNHYEPMIVVRPIEPALERDSQKIVITLLSDDETLSYEDDVDLEELSPSMSERGLGLKWGKLQLMGPCNGLFCINDTVDVVLFNPATRNCKQLSPPPTGLSPIVGGNFNCVSFGFDSVSNDYKVVRFDPDRCDVDVDDGCCHFKVDIYCLSTNSWRSRDSVVTAASDNKYIIHSDSSLLFNGACHWLGSTEWRVDYSSILVFDLNKEAFDVFQLPRSFSESDVLYIQPSILNECLAMVVHTDVDYDWDLTFKIWVMTKYGFDDSWRNLYNIGNDVGIGRPMSFGKKGEFLVQNSYGRLMSFNLDTKETKKFDVYGVPYTMYAFRYKKNLISLF